MRTLCVVGFVGTLLLLMIMNTWWQFHSHQSQLEAVHQKHAQTEQHLRRELVALRGELRKCSEDLEHRAKRIDSLKRRRAAECSNVTSGAAAVDASREEALAAERDALLQSVMGCRDELDFRSKAANSTAAAQSCPPQLHGTVDEFRRTKAQAEQNALDLQAANARERTLGLALAARVKEAKAYASSLVQEYEALLQECQDNCSKQQQQSGKSSLLGKFLSSQEGTLKAQSLGITFDSASKLGLFGGAIGAEFASGEEGQAEITSSQETAVCVAAVIPFRGRGVHLDMFYRHIAKFLESAEAKDLCWSFYIVEQYDAQLFNRGWLFNVGAAMAGLEKRKFKCIAIQDLDTLPEVGAGVDYADCEVPTQLSSEIECYGWLPPYAQNAGGVVTMSVADWHAINGFSNEYVGWGGEDDDLRLRLHQNDLLRGTCGSFCELEDRGFLPGMGGLIRRPVQGKGRFICLDEGAHTPRKHGDKKDMKTKLYEMQMGSDRWVFDGLSNLKFELLRHESRPFPNTTADAQLHWLKVASLPPQESGPVQSAALQHFGGHRVRLVLSGGACSRACVADKRCSAFPSKLPYTVAELQREFEDTLGGCMDEKVGGPNATLGFWLVDRNLLVTALSGQADVGGGQQDSPSMTRAPSSWALSEAIREAVDVPADGDPNLVIRAVPAARFQETLAGFRSNFSRQQKPIVDVCTGYYFLDDWRLGYKQTMNVGSDDCEQRSWTHDFSFKALRSPRSPRDRPVCVGEANGVWTARVDLDHQSCEGEALGVNWTHKSVFYIGDDATGIELCVRYRVETDTDLTGWSRWKVRRALDGGPCPESDKKWHAAFSFRSMEDTYEPPRTLLCVRRVHGEIRLQLGCKARHGVQAYAVLHSKHAASVQGEVYSICHAGGVHAIFAGDSCAGGAGAEGATEQGSWTLNGSFVVPPAASGRPWCLGYRDERSESGISKRVYDVQPRKSCGGITPDLVHVFALREVALEDLDEKLGLLSLASPV